MISIILSRYVKYNRYLIQKQIWFFNINCTINIGRTHIYTNFMKINVPNLAGTNFFYLLYYLLYLIAELNQ